MLGKREVRAFFTLLRTGLWRHPIDQLDCFPLSDLEWKRIYSHAIRHTVEGVLFDAVQTLDNEILPPKSMLRVWVVRVEKIAQRNARMDEVIKDQVQFFHQYNLSPVLLKGRGVATTYPNPKRRSCGDIDWCFEDYQDYEKATESLEKIGIRIHRSAGYSVNFLWKGFETDQHQRQFDISNPFLKRCLQDLEKEYATSEQIMFIDEVPVRLSAPILQSIQVNIHILKHLLSFGIGLRQLCDAARIYYTYSQNMDGVRLRKTYRKLGVLNWINTLHQILVEYIGLPVEELPFANADSKRATSVMEDIWQSGNFGFTTDDVNNMKQQQPVKREASTTAIIKRLITYLPYAPMEAISFPFLQLYSRWFH
ncbi:nucleotidyltransferase family protein [Sphingobacterium sp. SYP-B4668]|uniref:nucleotidyltransferase family protein n=1 Tax=Sphingobacterium sp. SYP-B4668 TaxID=2996035 RepID=UPI0022DD2868|nr:nucleotidyltransferase family protein [Sphingobacterium sp. SYP-B4668]